MAHALTQAALVWNRAFDWTTMDPDEDPDQFAGRVGDRHLRAITKPYGRAMGSGIDAVRDGSSPRQCRRAAVAFAYFGLPDLAEMFRRLAELPSIEEDGRARWAERHGDGWPRDQAFWGLEKALMGAFERKYAESPEDFDPVPPDGVERHRGAWPDGESVCWGDLLVHESTVECTRPETCPGVRRNGLHSRSRLHMEAGCELCPSGPAWAWTS